MRERSVERVGEEVRMRSRTSKGRVDNVSGMVRRACPFTNVIWLSCGTRVVSEGKMASDVYADNDVEGAWRTIDGQPAPMSRTVRDQTSLGPNGL